MIQKQIKRKKFQVIKQLDKLNYEASQMEANCLSEWEIQFIESLSERLDNYDSAFRDMEKGRLGDPLSALQKRKLKEIQKKLRESFSRNVNQTPSGILEKECEKKMGRMPSNTKREKPVLRLISNPTPPSAEPQAYIPRCARPTNGRKPKLVDVNKN